MSNTKGECEVFRWIKSAATVVTGLWIGSMSCVGFVVAPYLFALAARKSSAVPNSGVAAELIGPLLHGVDLLSIVVGGLLIVTLVGLRTSGQIPLGGRYFLSEIGVAAAVIGAAVNYWVIAPRIQGVKASLAQKYGAYHLSDKTDSLYGQFGQLHQTSTILFVVGLVGALVALVCLTQFPPLGTTREVR